MMGQPPRRHDTAREILDRAADYLLTGPASLEPAAGSAHEGRWLESHLLLERFVPRADPTEVLQLYHLPNLLKSDVELAEAPLVVRRFTWNRLADLSWARQHKPQRLEADIAYFTAGDSSARLRIADATMALDEALPRFPFQVEGLQPPDVAGDHEGARGPVRREPRQVYKLAVQRGTSFTGTHLRWHSGTSAQLEDAFFGLWEALMSVCTKREHVEAGWVERWRILPQDYLDALIAVLWRDD